MAFVKKIQSCATPLELFKLINFLEKLLPRIVLFNFPYQILGDNIISTNQQITTSLVGTYLYSLDRWIRYEDIPLDFYCEGVEYRPRLVYTPRCSSTPTCSKYFHHAGRCDVLVSIGDSKYREILPRGMQNPHPNSHSNNNINQNINSNHHNNSNNNVSNSQFLLSSSKSLLPVGQLHSLQQEQMSQYQQYQNKLYESRSLSNNMNMNGVGSTMRPYDPLSDPFSLEFIQPYIPKKEEIKSSEWV